MNGYNKINSLEDVEEDPVVKPDFRLNGNNKFSIDRDDFSTGKFDLLLSLFYYAICRTYSPWIIIYKFT